MRVEYGAWTEVAKSVTGRNGEQCKHKCHDLMKTYTLEPDDDGTWGEDPERELLEVALDTVKRKRYRQADFAKRYQKRVRFVKGRYVEKIDG